MFGQRTSLTMAGSRVERQTGSGESERSVSELQMKANDNEGLSRANEYFGSKRPKSRQQTLYHLSNSFYSKVIGEVTRKRAEISRNDLRFR